MCQLMNQCPKYPYILEDKKNMFSKTSTVGSESVGGNNFLL